MDDVTAYTPTSARRLRNTAVQGMLWVGADQIGRRVVDQVFTIFLARLLLPKDFGILALAAVFTTLLRIIGDTGMGSAIVQRREVDQEYLYTAFWASVGAGITLTAVAAALGGLVGRWLHEPVVGLVLIGLSMRFLITSGAQAQMAMITRRLDYRTLSLRSMTATVVGGVVGVGMAYAGKGVWSLVGQDLAMVTCGTILLYRATGWRPKLRFSWSKFLDLWSFGGRLQLSSFFNYLVRHMDNLLVGRYMGSTALGYYTFGYAVFLAPINDVGLLNQVLFSALSRLQDDIVRLKRGFLRALNYVTMIVLPMMVGLALVAPLLVSVVFGPKWLPSVPVIRLLALAGFLQVMMALGPIGLQSAGRPDVRLRFSFLSVLLYLPAFGIGLRWGIVGVAAAYLVVTILLVPMLYRYVARVIGLTIRETWGSVRASITACIVMTGVALPAMRGLDVLVRLPAVVALALLVAIGVVVYTTVMLIIQPQTIWGFIRVVREAVPALHGPRLREAREA